jgi:hypothetical protein
MTDPYLMLLKPFVECLDKLWQRVRDAKIRRNKDAAAYFEALASAMTRVLEGLRARQVPRIAGHEMEKLIHGFAERTKRVLSPTDSKELQSALANVAEIAKTLDEQIFFHQPSLEVDREQMLAQIERIIGDCKGLAAVLKPGV